MNKLLFWKYLRYILILGNILFILWIIRNGINEGFSGSIVSKVSYISLVILLGFNAVFIFRNK